MYSVFLNKAKFFFYLKKWADTKGTVLRKIILFTIEGDHDTVRASGADDAHQEHCCILSPYGADRGGVGQVQHEFTRLESELSFLQVRATMTLQETIRQVKAEICEDRHQIAHTRLESITGVENPYSLMQVFGRGYQVNCNGATVYVTRCQATGVLPRTHNNCTNEIPAILNGTNMFADPINFVIKASPALVRCNNIAPPRWRLKKNRPG
jgi:hypothetical protein